MAWTIKEGATRPTYAVQLREHIGTPAERPIDLRDAVGVDFLLRAAASDDQSPPKFNKPAVIMFPEALPDNEEEAGWIEYIWEAGDTDGIGDYEAEAWINWGPGATEKVPNKGYFAITIEADLTP
jgi:hypothetical protein